MNRALSKLLHRLVKSGCLRVTTANGELHQFGDGTGNPVHIVLHTTHAERAIAFDPYLALPESYMRGELDVIVGEIMDVLRIAFVNMEQHGSRSFFVKFLERFQFLTRRFHQLNSAARSKDNVHRHYDLSEELYRLFLDEDLQYSCAYFEQPEMTLEEAQRAKKRHIAAKLSLKPGQKVLDIGSGWGGMGLYLAHQFNTNVLGVTLSEEQHVVSRKRAQEARLDSKARFVLSDYRTLNGPFDRIVSVGMFEHVGINHYYTFFKQIARLLTDDGVMLLHTIGRTSGPSSTAAFIRKYIFPGGYIPALSEILPAIERAGLIVTDIEVLRLHYAETLRNWRERFLANRERVVEIYDERFARMWEFYLVASEASFRWQDMVNFQIQLTKRRDSLPTTRNYMSDTEAGLGAEECANVTSDDHDSISRPGLRYSVRRTGFVVGP
ncbi:class I SAM-dependent methyltransferase [Agrobacterium sp. FDAARGOS_525]|uniref:SAM-dependent methyltransferase n=1 Tax=Agrobacterium sp. FDAARGOS_525 TaxID=2420311 RepID=UPI000F6656BD|nr:cyclopropane-fatty-acyl-phospholipid synthase family protein [Agrobacterium sp. FDAARGOS_525]RSC37110.1 class I SAM-dependent methyltransferase [Agrobacterium sp. FDAARGOS_525]